METTPNLTDTDAVSIPTDRFETSLLYKGDSNMKIQISNRHETAHPQIKTMIEQELDTLGTRYEILGAEVILDHEGKNGMTTMSAEINLKVRGQVLTAMEKSEKVEKSIDLAMRSLEKQLKRHKETHYSSLDRSHPPKE